MLLRTTHKYTPPFNESDEDALAEVERICEKCIPLQFIGNGFERTITGMHITLRSGFGTHEFYLPDEFRRVAERVPQGHVAASEQLAIR